MKLIATSASIEGVEKLLREYFFSPGIIVNRETYEITNSKGPISGFNVVKTKNRFKVYDNS